WEAFLLFFSFQALFIALVLSLRRKGDKVANLIFSLILILFAYHIFFDILFWARFNEGLLLDLSLTLSLPLSLYGPLFYLYVKKTVTSKSITFRDTIHLLPFLTLVLFRIRFYMLPQEVKLKAIQLKDIPEYAYFLPYENILLGMLLISYVFVAYLHYIRKYKEDIELKIWLRTISGAFFIFALVCAIFFIGISLGWSSQAQEYYLIYVMVGFIAMVSYFVFAQPDIFNGKPLSEVIPFIKYEKTGLTEDFSLELKEKLHHIMENEKPYLNPEIRLDTIADLLNVSRHHASQVINEHFSTHFFDFINQYRIQEAERLLSVEKSKQSIKNIAYSSGFNNRISFYKAFKKMVGTTPTAYRNDCLSS
ncbi:MAG: AraC family transcriptional regulator, partial [Pricia sp.]|nr:AraC family transcriptional regulator [Pricia sp.]